jgi:ABC-type lipoprotein export system ATPase subunit
MEEEMIFTDAECTKFPKHDVMQIIHNPHILDGMSAREWIELTAGQIRWKSEEDAEEAIKTNSIWVSAWVSLDRPRDVVIVGAPRFDGLF